MVTKMKMIQITGTSGTYSIYEDSFIARQRAIGKRQEDGKSEKQQENTRLLQDSPVRKKAEQRTALSFHNKEDFGHIGKESSLELLDIKKAVSDMKKDKIFEEYQYFVGTKPDWKKDTNTNGNVFPK